MSNVKVKPNDVKHNSWCALLNGGTTCDCDWFVKESTHPNGLKDFYDLRFKGWNCRACKIFNGEEKEYLLACRCCGAARPTA